MYHTQWKFWQWLEFWHLLQKLNLKRINIDNYPIMVLVFTVGGEIFLEGQFRPYRRASTRWGCGRLYGAWLASMQSTLRIDPFWYADRPGRGGRGAISIDINTTIIPSWYGDESSEWSNRWRLLRHRRLFLARWCWMETDVNHGGVFELVPGRV